MATRNMSRRRRAATLAGATALAASVGSLALTGTPAHASTPDSTALHSYIVDARTPAVTARAEAAAVRAGGRVVQSWPQIGVVVVQSNRPRFLSALTAEHNPAVLMAADSRNQAVTEGATPASSVTVRPVTGRTGTTKHLTGRADPLVRNQSYLRTIGAIAANHLTEGNSRVVVGVLDGGVDASASDLRRNLDTTDSVNCTAGGRPDTVASHWTGSAHGTHVAGTIAADQQGTGVQGVAPHVRVASVKVVTASDTTWPEYLVCGFMWSGLKHFTVTNNSYNVYDLWCGQHPLASADIVAVQRAIAFASGQNVAHVQSAGNDGLDVHSQLGAACVDPLAGRSDVMHVSAVDPHLHLLDFSNTGMGLVDIAAPGEDIWSTLPGNRFGALTGTSQAAPQVSGSLALLASEHPGASAALLEADLEAHAQHLACRSGDFDCTTRGGRTSYYGAGLLNVKAAVLPARGQAVAPLVRR